MWNAISSHTRQNNTVFILSYTHIDIETLPSVWALCASGLWVVRAPIENTKLKTDIHFVVVWRDFCYTFVSLLCLSSTLVPSPPRLFVSDSFTLSISISLYNSKFCLSWTRCFCCWLQQMNRIKKYTSSNTQCLIIKIALGGRDRANKSGNECLGGPGDGIKKQHKRNRRKFQLPVLLFNNFQCSSYSIVRIVVSTQLTLQYSSFVISQRKLRYTQWWRWVCVSVCFCSALFYLSLDNSFSLHHSIIEVGARSFIHSRSTLGLTLRAQHSTLAEQMHNYFTTKGKTIEWKMLSFSERFLSLSLSFLFSVVT